MAKSVSLVDKLSNPLGVKWNLKENDDGRLEWITEYNKSNLTQEQKDKKKRAKAAEARAPITLITKKNERATSTRHKTGGNMHGNRHTSPQRQKRKPNQFVLLEDIKAVAYDQLSEISTISPDFDKIIFKAPPFDDFLYHLIFYFDRFFVKMDQEQKAKASTSIAPGLLEKKEFADACAKVEVARKMLGRSYCHLVLGLDLEDAHHMACGSKRVSDTKRDRFLYETLYSYCCFVVWIAFRRKEFDVIKREMGSTLRSNTFNPAIRVKNAPEKDEDERTDVNNPKKKMSPAEYRRIHPKRPAIKSILTQRSPAVVSILPSSREEAPYLFKNEKSLPQSSILSSAKDTLSSDKKLSHLVDELEHLELKNMRIGILNDVMENYNAMSLQGGGQEADGTQEESATENDGSEEINIHQVEPPLATIPDTAGLRPETAVSAATTFAPSEL